MNEYKALILNAFLFAQIVASNPAPSGERGDLVGSKVNYSAYSLGGDRITYCFPLKDRTNQNKLLRGLYRVEGLRSFGKTSSNLIYTISKVKLESSTNSDTSSNVTVITADYHWKLVHGDEELKKPRYLSEAVVRDILFQNGHLFPKLKQLNPDLTMSIVGLDDMQVLSPEGWLVTNALQLLAIIKKGTAENPVILQVVFPRRVTR